MSPCYRYNLCVGVLRSVPYNFAFISAVSAVVLFKNYIFFLSCFSDKVFTLFCSLFFQFNTKFLFLCFYFSFSVTFLNYRVWYNVQVYIYISISETTYISINFILKIRVSKIDNTDFIMNSFIVFCICWVFLRFKFFLNAVNFLCHGSNENNARVQYMLIVKIFDKIKRELFNWILRERV